MNNKYNIAGLNVIIDVQCERLLNNAAKFKADFDSPDITITADNLKLAELQNKYKGMSFDDLVFMYTGSVFYRKILDFNGVLLHAAAIKYKGIGLAFSADSGTGKSTHAALWKTLYPNDVTIINDDKPAIRKIDGHLYIYGTPWSGKADINENESAELAAVFFIKRSQNNFIYEITAKDAASRFFKQTIRPKSVELAEKLLETSKDIIESATFFELNCNKNFEAVKTVEKVLENRKLLLDNCI